MKTLIYCMPDFVDLARKLRENYIAHRHEKADIISEEEKSDIASGYTRRCPVSEVLYRD